MNTKSQAMALVKRAVYARRASLAKVALDNVGSEIGGTIAAPITGAVGGAGAGALIAALVSAIRGRDIGRGAGVGAGAGAVLGAGGAHLANLGGMITGAIRKRRTKKEQQKHDSKSHWENLIPGVASYNYTKRVGRVLAGVGEPDEQKEKTEKKAAAAQLAKTAAPRVNPSLLARLMVALSPQLRMPKVEWQVAHPKMTKLLNKAVGNPVLAKLVRPFVKSTVHRTRLRGTPEEVARVMEDSFAREFAEAGGVNGLHAPSGSAHVSGAISPSGSASVSGSVHGNSDLLNHILGGGTWANVTRHRLRPGRVAAALGAGVLGGGGAYAATRDNKPAPRDDIGKVLAKLWANPDVRAALLGSAVGGVGGAALGGGDLSDRLLRGLAGAAIGGGIGYGAQHYLNREDY